MSETTTVNRSGSLLTARAAASAIVWSISLGLVVAVVGAQSRMVSIDIWLLAFTVWAGVLVTTAVVKRAPLQEPPLLALWQRASKERDEVSKNRQIRSVENLIVRSRDNERAFVSQMRPRLRTLAAHNLRLAHGIDLDANPDRVAAVLGDSAWLLDPAVVTRRPTVQDLNDFLNRIEGDLS